MLAPSCLHYSTERGGMVSKTTSSEDAKLSGPSADSCFSIDAVSEPFSSIRSCTSTNRAQEGLKLKTSLYYHPKLVRLSGRPCPPVCVCTIGMDHSPLLLHGGTRSDLRIASTMPISGYLAPNSWISTCRSTYHCAYMDLRSLSILR